MTCFAVLDISDISWQEHSATFYRRPVLSFRTIGTATPLHRSARSPSQSSAPTALEWIFRCDQPESERIRPAAELAAALSAGLPIRVEHAVIEGDVQINALAYAPKLAIHHTVFRGHFHLSEGRFDHTIDLTGCEFREGINLFATRIDGQLKLPKATIRRGSRPPVVHNFDQIEVRGRLNGARLTSEIGLSFRQARLGEVGFDGIHAAGDLDFQLADVAGDFFCEAEAEALDKAARAEVLGRVRLSGAKIGGQATFRGARISEGLLLVDAEVREDLRCGLQGSLRCEILGPVRLTGAKIGGMAYFGGARLGQALKAAPAVCRNAVWMQAVEINRGLHFAPEGEHLTEIYGNVFGVSAHISHQLSFDRAYVHGDVDLQRAVINGRLLFAFDEDYYRLIPDALGRDCHGRLQIDGRLLLSGVQAQELVLDGRLFDTCAGAPEDPPTRADERRLFYRRMLTGELEPGEDNSRLKLDRARFSKLQIEEKVPEGISADGMSFDDLQLPRGSCEYSELPRRTRPFKKSPYLAVEGWLRNKGFDQEARRVYMDMCDRDLNAGQSPRIGRWLRWLFLGVMIGYGTRPLRLLWIFLLAFTLSLAIFSQPASLVSYSEKPAMQPDPWPIEAQHTWVTAGVALRCHFPMLFFAGEPNYVPSPNRIPHLGGLTYDGYALLVSSLSWIMVPLFLAGITGIVRQET
jgi:hypothetical protein